MGFVAARKPPTSLPEALHGSLPVNHLPIHLFTRSGSTLGQLAGRGCLLPIEAPAYRQPSGASLLLSCFGRRGLDLHARDVCEDYIAERKR